MSEPIDPFSDSEEMRMYEIARDVLSQSVRHAVKRIAYDDLDELFGIEPSESQRRLDYPGRRSSGVSRTVVDEQYESQRHFTVEENGGEGGI